MSALTWVGVALFGGLGALARFLLDGWIGTMVPGGFPFGTFLVNLSGAFLLGLLVGLALHGDPLILAGTATLGAYTTFSTWMLETQDLSDRREFTRAVINAGLSLAVGFGAIAVGRVIGTHL